MHPKGGIPPPQGSSNMVEQMFGAIAVKTVECKAHQSTIVIVNLRRSFFNPHPEVSLHYPRMHGNQLPTHAWKSLQQNKQRARMAERQDALFSAAEVLEMIDHSDSDSDSEEEQDCEEMFFPGSDEEFAYVEEDNE